jgi:hypothetical protein
MRIVFESDRECTIDGVGLLKPGEPVEVDEITFRNAHGYSPAQANFPPFITVTYDTSERGE